MPASSYCLMMARAWSMVFCGVVAQARIHFSGNAARDNLEDPPAEGDGQALEGEVGHVLVAGMLALLVAGLFQHLVHYGLILRHLRGSGDQRRIGSGVGGPEFLDGFKITGIGDDRGVTAQLLQQILRHDSSRGGHAMGWGQGKARAPSVPLLLIHPVPPSCTRNHETVWRKNSLERCVLTGHGFVVAKKLQYERHCNQGTALAGPTKGAGALIPSISEPD